MGLYFFWPYLVCVGGCTYSCACVNVQPDLGWVSFLDLSLPLCSETGSSHWTHSWPIQSISQSALEICLFPTFLSSAPHQWHCRRTTLCLALHVGSGDPDTVLVWQALYWLSNFSKPWAHSLPKKASHRIVPKDNAKDHTREGWEGHTREGLHKYVKLLIILQLFAIMLMCWLILWL